MTHSTTFMTPGIVSWFRIQLAIHYGNGLDKKTYEEREAFFADMDMDALWDMALDPNSGISKPNKFKQTLLAFDNYIAFLDGDTSCTDWQKHPVGLDVTNCGFLLLNLLMGSESGLRATGCIDPYKCNDATLEIVKSMNGRIPDLDYRLALTYNGKRPKDTHGNFVQGNLVRRSLLNRALSAYLYGGEDSLVRVFSDVFPKLPKKQVGSFVQVFMDSFAEVGPGASQLREALLDIAPANPGQITYTLPSPIVGVVNAFPLIQKNYRTMYTPIAELGTEVITTGKVHAWNKKNVSLLAHATHSVDALLMQELTLMCGADHQVLEAIYRYIKDIPIENRDRLPSLYNARLLINRNSSTFTTKEWFKAGLTENDLGQLAEVIKVVLRSKHSFQVFSTHDNFYCPIQNINRMRFMTNFIMRNMLHSDMANQILKALWGCPQEVVYDTNERIIDRCASKVKIAELAQRVIQCNYNIS